MYDYNIEMLYTLINQHNLQKLRDAVIGRTYLTDESIEEIQQRMKKDKQEDINNESKEMRAVDFF